jgi:putative peptidoglycan lipid II flippase
MSFVVGMTAGAVALAFIQYFLINRLRQVNDRNGAICAEQSQPTLPGTGLMLMALYALTSQGHMIVDRAFAASLPPGSVAALNYANAILAVPGSVLVYAAGVLIMPHLAAMHATQQHGRARVLLRKALLGTSLALAPVVILLVMYADVTVGTLLQRGQFDRSATETTAVALSWLAPMVLLSCVATMLTRDLMASRQWKVIMLIGICTLGLKVLLNYLLVDTLQLRGLAIATVATSIFGCLVRIWVWARVRPYPIT